MPSAKKNLLQLGTLILLIGLFVFIFLKYFRSSLPSSLSPFSSPSVSDSASALPSPSPTPRPIKELPSGKQVYNVSHGPKVVGPKIQQIILDPQTPSPKETQTVTIKVKNDSPVTEAIAYVETDNQKTKNVLKLIEGTTTDGTWQGSWKITDTYNYNYYIRFNLKSATGEYNDGMRLRE